MLRLGRALLLATTVAITFARQLEGPYPAEPADDRHGGKLPSHPAVKDGGHGRDIRQIVRETELGVDGSRLEKAPNRWIVGGGGRHESTTSHHEHKRCRKVMQDIQDGVWVSDTDVCQSSDAYLSTMCTKVPKLTAFETSQNRKFNDSYKPGLLWGPSKCSLRAYSALEARALMTRIGGFMVVGESVERHVAQAFINVLTDDFAGTSAISHLDKVCPPSGNKKKWSVCYDPKLCKGDMQFSEKVRHLAHNLAVK
jgi:hypothetical protein